MGVEIVQAIGFHERRAQGHGVGLTLFIGRCLANFHADRGAVTLAVAIASMPTHLIERQRLHNALGIHKKMRPHIVTAVVFHILQVTGMGARVRRWRGIGGVVHRHANRSSQSQKRTHTVVVGACLHNAPLHRNAVNRLIHDQSVFYCQ